MEAQQEIDYKRIAAAILFLQENYKAQPDLETVAAQVHLSPFHFQRMFRAWAGISPTQFMHYLSIGYAKQLLSKNKASLAQAAFSTGLSGTGRLHDLFIKIEGMTPGEYKGGAKGLSINYSISPTPFGEVLIASTSKGVCYIAFADEGADAAFQLLKAQFPNAAFIPITDAAQQNALRVFSKDWSSLREVKLHLKGTPFQVKVWEALLKIPSGDRVSYGHLAGLLSNPGAGRAVGTAVGDNPVAYLIPCHRVIRATGAIGEYHWGSGRKGAMLGWEAAAIHPANEL